jgi:hypothetical protein
MHDELREESYEYGLPAYLQNDLDCYKRALAGEEGYANLIDCYWGELYGSINGALINDGAITPAHAEYLRNKFL